MQPALNPRTVLFFLIALITDTTWSLLFSGVCVWLRRPPGFNASGRCICRGVYLGPGLLAMASGHGRT